MSETGALPQRLPEGGAIDRDRPLRLRVDGSWIEGFEGDTVASAMLAAGMLRCGDSIYRGRPRGVFTAGPEEPNAYLRVLGQHHESMLQATSLEARDGLEAEFLRGIGSLDARGPDDAEYDKRHAHADVIVIGAGPAGISAALQAASSGARVVLLERDAMLGGDLLCASPGLRIDGDDAATWLRAASARLRAAGECRVLRRTSVAGSYDGNTLVALERRDDHPFAGRPGVSRQRLWHFTARRIVLATGAEERQLVFPGNDLPGIMLTSAARAYARRYAIRLAGSALVAATDDTGYDAALALAETGARVTIADARPAGEAGEEVSDRAARAGIEVVPGSVVVEGHGDARIEAASVASLDAQGRATGTPKRIACDLLALGGGWNPAVQLHSQRQGRLAWCREHAAFLPAEPVAGQFLAGALAGSRTIRAAIASGIEAGRAAAAEAGFPAAGSPAAASLAAAAASDTAAAATTDDTAAGATATEPSTAATGTTAGETTATTDASAAGPTATGVAAGGPAAGAPVTDGDPEPAPARPVWLALPPGSEPEALDRAFADPHRDVTAADLLRATGAGLRSIEHVKRHSSLGTGAEQGRAANVNAIGIIAAALGGAADGTGDADPATVGTTMFRAPSSPIAFAAIAGRARGERYDPVRLTPSHDWAERHGAVFEDVGQWKRARYFPRPGESMDDAVARECRAARTGVAFMDATTLGKIEIRGRDAGTFLNRIYTNAFAKLTPGKARYGVMCTPDGMVFDDGVTLRLDEERYFMTTTTGGAARVLEWLEEWLQTEWPELDVLCTSATEQIATIAVAGPRSRDVIAKLLPDQDVRRDAWGFMEFREVTLASGIPARVCRISFSGELAFEINVPTWYGASVWEQVAEAGAGFGITPYGTETMHVLRAEKAFPIVGQDTDGTVTPQDLGMDWIVSKTKDFIGKRSYARASHAVPRKQLVALLPRDRSLVLPEGTQIIEADIDPASAPRPVPMLGHVTSSYHSEALGRSFALALVLDGRSRIGERVRASFNGTSAEAEIADPVLYDPEGERRDGEPGEDGPPPAAPDGAGAGGEPEQLRRSPAARCAERMAGESSGRVTLKELPFRTMIGLRVQPGSPAAGRCADALGLRLPERCGEVGGDSSGAGTAVLWISPDELLVVAGEQRASERAALLASLADAIGRDPGQAIDLSANRAILELRGPAAREVLEKSCAIDLHDRAFPPGTAVATLMGAFPVLLWRAEPGTWRVLPRTSFAEAAADWLLDGMREFAHEDGANDQEHAR